MEKENILLADYKDSIMIKICLLGALFIVIFAAPFVVLPSKDAIESLLMTRNKRFSLTQNIIVTSIIISMAYYVAVYLKTIGDAMTVLGATTNPLVGFLLPIIFYNKIETRFFHRLFSVFVFIGICFCSIIELYGFISN